MYTNVHERPIDASSDYNAPAIVARSLKGDVMRSYVFLRVCALLAACYSPAVGSTSLQEDPFDIIKNAKTKKIPQKFTEEIPEGICYFKSHKIFSIIITINNPDKYQKPFVPHPQWLLNPLCPHFQKSMDSKRKITSLKSWNKMIKIFLLGKNYIHSQRETSEKYEEKKPYINTRTVIRIKRNNEYTNIHIGQWLVRQRMAHNKGELEPRKAWILDQLGLSADGEHYKPFSKFPQEHTLHKEILPKNESLLSQDLSLLDSSSEEPKEAIQATIKEAFNLELKSEERDHYSFAPTPHRKRITSEDTIAQKEPEPIFPAGPFSFVPQEPHPFLSSDLLYSPYNPFPHNTLFPSSYFFLPDPSQQNPLEHNPMTWYPYNKTWPVHSFPFQGWMPPYPFLEKNPNPPQ